MRPLVMRQLAMAGFLLALAAGGPARSAPASGRVPLVLEAPQPVFRAQPDGGVVPIIDGFGLTSRPGEPALPLRILMVAIPEGVQPRLEILRADARGISGLDLSYVPSPEGRVEAAGRRDASFPEAALRLGRIGWMRDQRYVEVFYTPLLYNPAARVARLFTRIEAEVRFDLDGEDAVAVTRSEGRRVGRERRGR